MVSERDRYSWSFEIYFGAQEIGYMNCTQEPAFLNLGDFKLYNHLQAPESLGRVIIRKLLNRPRPLLNYRNRGIGTAMLALVERLTADAGFRRVQGWISRVDADPNPDLPDWYRRRGYTVTVESTRFSQQVAIISKELPEPR